MSATFDTANNEILDTFKTAWDTTGNVAIYENVKDQSKPPIGNSYARLTVRHSFGEQASLSNSAGSIRFDRAGIVTVQVFSPLGEPLSVGYVLAKIVADAFEGQATPSQVWFRNVRISEIGPSDEWFQINVLIDFTYDEIK